MITLETYEYVPKYEQWIYVPDGTVLRSKRLARWYAFYKWRIEHLERDITGMVESIEYTFPNKRYPFTYNSYKFVFLPDFIVKFVRILQPEHQTFTYIKGNYGKMLRIVMHKYPELSIRVIEPNESKKTLNNLKNGGLTFDNLIVSTKQA